MFEKILQNILEKQLGQFIVGFDAKNLSIGVWSGDVIIENVSIKPEVLQMLELPIQLKHSFVGRLQIKLPWASLSSKPIEVILDKVYMILSPIKKEDWNFFDFKSLDKKLEQLDQYATSFVQKMQNMSKGETKQQDPGYVQRLTMKIVDNLQITVKSINIRFENNQQIGKQPFALGISLNQLDIVTTNSEWKAQFIDRTNSDIPMRKLLKLQNLDIYWLYENALIFSDGKQENFNKQLEEQIQQNPGKIISISADMKLVQNNPGNFTTPEFQVTINLNQIDLLLHKVQMQQVIQLVEFINIFQEKLNKLKNENKKVSDFDLQKFEAQFKNLYSILYNSKDKKLQNKNDIEDFNNILVAVDIDQITNWSQPILKEFCQQQQIQNMKNQKKGWFTGWYGQQDDSQDVEKIQQFFNEITQDKLNVNVSKRPIDYIWFSLAFSLQSGCIQVSQMKNNVLESIKFSYENLSVKLFQRETNTQVDLGLGNILIDLIDQQNSNITKTNFLNRPDDQKEDIIQVKYQKNPLINDQNKIQLDQIINLDLLPVNIIYNHYLVDRLGQIFQLQSDDSIKQLAWDKIDKTLDNQQEKLIQVLNEPNLMKVEINLSSPVIYLPISQSECWRLNLGKFCLKTDEKTLDKKQKYDIYKIQLDQTQMDFLVNQQCQYTVINEFQIQTKIDIIRPQFKGQGCDMNIIGVLQHFNLNLTQLMYRKILKISDIFQSDQKIEQVEIVTRKQLIPKAKKIGEIYLKEGKNDLDWNKFQVLATQNGYFYFFRSSKGDTPDFSYYIRQSVTKELPPHSILTVFQVKNRYTDITLGWEKHDAAMSWIKLLDGMNIQQKPTQQIQQNINPNQQTLMAQFQINDMGLVLEKEDKQQIMCFQTQYLNFYMSQRPYDQNIQISLGQLYLKDNVRTYMSQQLNYFITSDNKQQKLISLDIQMIDQKSPNYKNTEMIIDAKFGRLFINFKCETMIELMNFIKAEQVEQPKAIQQVVQEPQKKQNLNQSRSSVMVNHLRQSHAQSIIKKVDDQIKTKFNINLQQIQLTCINKLTFLQQGSIIIQNSNIQFIQKQFQNDVSIELGNLQIIDYTNYPNSLIREEQYKDIKDREIFGVASLDNNILTVKVKMYQQQVMVDSIGMEVDVCVNKVKIDFMMQPLMRFMDVTLVQMLSSFGDSQEAIQITLEDSQKTLDNLSFMDLNVKINESVVMVKSSEQCQEFLELSFGLIQIKNKIDSSNERVDSEDIDSIWIQYYFIHLREMQMKIVKNNQKFKISRKFEFYLSIEMPMFIPQYKLVYPNVQFDNSMVIKSKILPIILSLSHNDYLIIMKVLNANISYDDLLDKYFYMNYEQKINQEFAGIDFQLDIQKITLILLENNLPFSQISLDEFRIIFQKLISKSHIEIIGVELEGTYFEKIDDYLYEQSLLGNLNFEKKYPIQNILEVYQQTISKIPGIQILLKDQIQYQIENYNKNNNQDLYLKIDMQNSGQKYIDIQLQDFNLNSQLKQLIKISQFGGMDNSVVPPDPKIYYQSLQLPQIIQNQVVLQNEMQVKITTKDIMIQIQDKKIKNCLAITSQIQIVIQMNPSLGFEETLKQVKQNEINFEKSYELNETMKMDLMINKLEVFICDKNDLKTMKFNQVLKRNLLNPFNMFLTYKTYLQLNSDHYFTNKQIVNLNIEPAIVQISFTNIENIQLIMNQQLSQLEPQQEQKKIEIQQIEENQNDKLTNLVLNKKKGDILDVSEMLINMKMQKLQIGIINDTVDAVPILDILSNCELNMVQSIQNTTIMVLLGLKLAYFNPQKSRWEPVVEQTGFKIDLLQNQFVNPKFILNLQVNELDYKYVNINISTQFLNVITNGFSNLQKSTQRKQIELDEDYNLVVKVSPYKIHNLTGYKIQVDKDEQQSVQDDKLILFNQQKMNFQVESNIEEFEQEVMENDLQNMYFVQFVFLNDKFQNQKIKKINLDRVKTIKQNIQDQNKINHPIVLSVDIIDDRKLLTISSLIVFKNTTNLNLQIRFQNSQYQTLNLEKDELVPIPFDLIMQKVFITYDFDQSQLIDLTQILVNQDNTYEIKLQEKYINLVVKKQNQAKGYTLVKLAPPFTVQNCLPNKLFIQLGVKSKIVSSIILDPLEILEEFNISKNEIVQIAIKYQNFDRSNCLLSQNKYFEVVDNLGNIGKINILQDTSFYGCQKYYFYLESYILNQTSIDLSYLTSKEKNKKFNQLCGFKNYNYISILNDDTFLILDYKDVQSQPINIKSSGTQFSEIKTDKGLLEVVLQTDIIKPTNFIVSRQIKISPRFILINNSKQNIYIRQCNTQQNIQINQGEKQPYFWFDKTIQNLIQVSFNQQTWSGDVQINGVGEIALLLRNSDKDYQIIKLDIRLQYNIIYIYILDSQKDNELYMIQNQLDLNITYGQIEQQKTVLNGLNSQEFGWDQPLKQKIIVIIFSLLGNQHRVEVNMDKMNSIYNFDDTNIIARTQLQGVTRKIIIEKQIQYDKSKTIDDQMQPESVINFAIKRVGISLISNFNDQKSKEFLYIYLNQLEICLSSNKKKSSTQLRLKYINIDNNSEFQTRYPVLFTPHKYKKYKKEQNYFLNILLVQNLEAKQCTFYDQFTFEIEPFSLKVEDSFFEYVSDFSNQLFEGMEYKYQNPIQQVSEIQDWKKDQEITQIIPTFIDNFIVSPIKIQITINCNFQSKQKKNQNELIAFITGILSSLGSSIINIDDAHITLKGIQLKNCFDSKTGIINKMTIKYKDDFMPQILLLLGSLDFIGNPVGLFSNIGTGLEDLIQKPKEGFVKGPLEGGLGVIQGAGSLFKNTLAGSLNTVNKITGSLGQGFAGLSLDDEYLKKRQQQKAQKAKNMGQGLKQAGLSLFSGVEQGVTGLFTKPMEGFKSGGITGFLSGSAKGVVGLIVKPVTGVLDGASKTMEGMKNQVTSSDDKPNDKRERTPRNFYGPEKFYKAYNGTDADAFQILQQIDNQKYMNRNNFLGFINILKDSHLIDQQDLQKYLIICIENIIYLNLKNLKLEQDIQASQIKSAIITPTSIILNVTSKIMNQNIEIKVLDKKQRELIHQRIQELMDIVNELK